MRSDDETHCAGLGHVAGYGGGDQAGASGNDSRVCRDGVVYAASHVASCTLYVHYMEMSAVECRLMRRE